MANLTKIQWKPGTVLSPVPAVMVTCLGKGDGKKPNIITLAWAGTVNSEPPMLSISVRKSRYSHGLLMENPEFVVNMTTEKLVYATDLCGVKSGRDIDKFKETGLTPAASAVVSAPMIKECPVALECKVINVLELGSHDMFIGEIVSVHVDEALVDSSGKLDLGKTGLICYNHGEYWSLKEKLGFFGYSVADPDVLKRRMGK